MYDTHVQGTLTNELQSFVYSATLLESMVVDIGGKDYEMGSVYTGCYMFG